MPEETPAAASSSGSMEEKPCSSTSTQDTADSTDIMEEAKKLIGTGNRHLVMGDFVSAVSVFQEACGMLAAKYGDTADECAEAFFLCGKSLLELARMENTVLGNALEGVPEESDGEGDKPENTNIESANNLDDDERDELRRQVYEAMAEPEKAEGAETKVESSDGGSATEVKAEDAAAVIETELQEAKSMKEGEKGHEVAVPEVVVTTADQDAVTAVADSSTVNESLENGAEKIPSAVVDVVTAADPVTERGTATGSEEVPVNGAEKSPSPAVIDAGKVPTASPGEECVTVEKVQTSEQDKAEDPSEDAEGEVAEEDDDDEDEDDDDAENAEEKEEDEVGNLQLAWEMLEVAKVIYKRKENKEDQLMAAQALLKLGEVGAETGNYPQALEDFQECLALQLKHLAPHSRLLAESHYHVATTLCYMDQYSQAIQHYSSSIKVIENRFDVLQKAITAAEGTDGAADEMKEMEELKLLLPEIKEKVEDAKESQRTASAASQAIQHTLGGASTSSAFPSGSSAFTGENGGPSSSPFATPSQITVKPSDGASSSSKVVSDISHLVRKKRKPEEESPEKEADAKQLKQEATVNGSGGSAVSNGNGVQEKEAQEPAKPPASVQSSA